jgi:hypothetical protein
MIANNARAQLCLTAAESKSLPNFAEAANLSLLSTKTIGSYRAGKPAAFGQISLPLFEPSVSFASALSPATAAGVLPKKFLPQLALAQNTAEVSIRPQVDVVHKLLLAASLPSSAETNLQLMFAE